MSKTIALSLVLAASLGLSACGKEAATTNAMDNAVENAEVAADNAMMAAENLTDASANVMENVTDNAM